MRLPVIRAKLHVRCRILISSLHIIAPSTARSSCSFSLARALSRFLLLLLYTLFLLFVPYTYTYHVYTLRQRRGHRKNRAVFSLPNAKVSAAHLRERAKLGLYTRIYPIVPRCYLCGIRGRITRRVSFYSRREIHSIFSYIHAMHGIRKRSFSSARFFSAFVRVYRRIEREKERETFVKTKCEL